MNNLTCDYIKRREFSFDSNNIADNSKVRHNKFIITNNFLNVNFSKFYVLDHFIIL